MSMNPKSMKSTDSEYKPVGGYHLRSIKKGTLGKVSKIREELEESEDAIEQGIDIMLLVELSDMIGAIEAVAEANGSSLDYLLSLPILSSGNLNTIKQKVDLAEQAEKSGDKDVVIACLSKMIPALAEVALAYKSNLTHLLNMHKVTKRAFVTGTRK